MSELRENIRDRLNVVFQDVFGDDEIVILEEMTAGDLEEWDSLMHITLIVAAEKEFGVQFNLAEIGTLENVGALIDIITERSNK